MGLDAVRETPNISTTSANLPVVFFTPKRHRNFDRIDTPRSGDCRVVAATDASIEGVHGARDVFDAIVEKF